MPQASVLPHPFAVRIPRLLAILIALACAAPFPCAVRAANAPSAGATEVPLSPDRYDAEDRLIERHCLRDGREIRLRFRYDADGHRVEKAVESVDPKSGAPERQVGRDLVDTLNPTAFSQAVATLHDGHAAQARLAGLRPVAEIALDPDPGADSGEFHARYLLTDGQGTTRALLDATPGASADPVSLALSLDAFGNPVEASRRDPATATWVSAGPDLSRDVLPGILFAGESFDADLGLVSLRARDYSADLGRFVTADSFEGRPRDPLSLHRYLYCGGDPLNRWDPTGHEFNAVGLLNNIGGKVMLFVMGGGPVVTAGKFGLATLTLAAAAHDPGNFVAAFESPAVAFNLLAMDLEFVAYYGRRTADFVTGYAALRLDIRPKVEAALADAAERVRGLDAAAVVGFRGSTARGYKGPHKGSDPFDPELFDVDAFIVSDRLAADIPRIRGARFPRAENSPQLVDLQQGVDQSLRTQLPGLKKSPFTFRVYTAQEFNRRQADSRLLSGEE